MNLLKTGKEIAFFKLLCVSVYFSSYLTRINYAAIIIELISEGNVTKSQAAIVTTTAFITYGVGQLISGYFGDRFSPRLLIFYGFLATAAMNIFMPFFANDPLIMSIIWGLNGIAQAFMWPPLLRIMTVVLSPEEYAKTVPIIGMGSATATIIVYLVSPFIIALMDWRFVFYVFGGFVVLVSFFWLVSTGILLKSVTFKRKKKQKEEVMQASGEENKTARLLIKLLPVIILTIAMQGVLRDGISTWVPTLMKEKFGMSSVTSIITSVGLPLFHVINNLVTYRVLRAMRNRVFNTIVLYFLLAGGLFTVMYLFGMKSMWVSLGMVSLSSGIIHGVNLLQTGYIPKYFQGTGSVATISGILNFSTYIGSAVSTYLFAVLSEKYGWNMTVLSWIVFAFLGAGISYGIQTVASRRKIRS